MFAASKTAGAVSAAPPASSDPQFNYVSLLLNDTGTNGQQNNTFLDSSSNNFTITRNGTPTQGSVTPYWPDGQWSNYFSVSQKLTIGAATNNNISTGDFTIEGWICFSDISTSWTTYNPSNQYIFDIGANGSYFSWRSDTGGRWVFQGTGLTNPLTYTNVPVVNTWYHFAITRSGNTFRLFINGDLKDTQTNTGTLSSSSWNIGSYGGAGNYGLSGYLSNFRVVKGTALYTSNFTPSTTPLTAVSGTSLLTCQSNRFKDNSSNNFAITVTGTPTVQAFEPFEPASSYATSVGGSGYFGGNTQYLTASSNAAFAFPNEFTVEGWFYWTTAPSAGQITGVLAAGGFNITYNTTLQFNLYGTGAIASATFTPVAGRWYHIAMTRNSSNLCTVWINGVSSATGTSSASFAQGAWTLYGGSNNGGAGYVSNFRIVKGTAVYTSNFTPPTSPVTAITGTSLLLNCTNAGIYDAATLNDLVTVGNAQVSTAQAKFGSSSMAFDGNGDLLSMPYDPTFSLKGTYTVEAWIYPTTVSGWRPIFTIQPAVTGFFGNFGLVCNGSQLGFELRPSNGASATAISAGTVVTNTWQHVAISVNAGSGRLFLNGTQVGSTTTFPDFTFTPVGVGVGANVNGFSNTTEVFNGYIDDLRVTKGYARYTANFTPPTAPFPTR